MRVLSNCAPIKRDSFGAFRSVGTLDNVPFWNTGFLEFGLVAVAIAATLTIWIRDPLAEWGCELAALILATIACVRRRVRKPNLKGLAICAIAFWGLAQLLVGATVYRYASWNASARFASLGAMAFLASEGGSARNSLRVMAWFGCAVSVVSVLAYYTSPEKVLWIFPIQNSDAWGPFLNRDNFAQFLELAMPVALWIGVEGDRLYLWMAAAMLAGGIASASRAGAALLVGECVAIVLLAPGSRRAILRFFAAGVIFIAIAGAGQLSSRLNDPDPMRYRREMAASAIQMIRERPWTGFGLGTFATVYPQFATFDAGLAVDHAHNDWLEWASEGGLGFAAVWIVLAAAVGRDLRRQWWRVGVAAVMVHAIVDFPFARFGIAAWIFSLIGMREVSRWPHLHSRRHP